MLTDRANAICILEILREYSDENHILSMREVISKLNSIYAKKPDRRTVYSSIELLQNLGYDISTYDENGIGYYLRERDFELAEIRLLMDAVYSCSYIPPKQTEYLIQKLQKQLSIYERKHYRHLTVVRQEHKTQNAQVFFNIEILDEAITQKKKVAFIYLDYDIKKQLVPRREKKYVVSPYGMVCENEQYYLVNIRDGFDEPSLYRIDLMRDIEILDDSVTILPKDANLDSVQNVTYAFVGKPEKIVLRCDRFILRHVLDHFGTDINISDNGDETFTAAFYASPNGVRYWALQYMEFAEVLEPKKLREQVIEIVRKNKYNLINEKKEEL